VNCSIIAHLSAKSFMMTVPKSSLLILFSALAVASTAGGTTGRRVDQGKSADAIVPAPEARNHVGKECTAELTDRASKNAVPRRIYYLDSEEDFHDSKNLSIMISYDHAAKFQKAGIDDPADYFKSKTIRVTGKVIEEDDQIRIRVSDPDQIKVVERK
jgi:hypothetical protein